MSSLTISVDKRALFFKWRMELTAVKKITLAFGMAGVTGLLAQVYIPLPFTPVPVTGQVLGALLSGVVCGAGYGAFSQLLYFSLGIMGVPWFAGHTGGVHFLFAPTTGYLIGFIVSAYTIGKYVDKNLFRTTKNMQGFLSQLGIMMTGVGIIYFFGAVVLAFVMNYGMWETIVKGVIPFIFIDFAKSGIAATVSFAVFPKKNAPIKRQKS